LQEGRKGEGGMKGWQNQVRIPFLWQTFGLKNEHFICLMVAGAANDGLSEGF